MSRFPKVTETFILREFLELRRLGTDVTLFPLIRGREPVSHEGALRAAAEAEYVLYKPASLLLSQVYWLFRKPLRYLSCWLQLWPIIVEPGRFLRSSLAVLAGASIARRMQQRGIPLIHAHWATYPTVTAMTAARLTAGTYSFTAHAQDIFITQKLLKRKVHRAAFVVTISEFNRRFIEAVAGTEYAEKLKVIHCGVVTTERGGGDGRETIGDGTQLRILSVGALEEKKGHATLVDACHLLRRRGRSLDCTIIGDGGRRAPLLSQIDTLGLAGTVRLVGAQTSDEVGRLMRAADLLAVPSVRARDGRMEGIPVVIMEAMSVGLPVVATRIGGVPEIVDHEVTGLLVDPGNAVDLADAIERLADDSELKALLTEAGGRKVRLDFDLAVSVGKLQSLFDGSPIAVPLESGT